LWLDSQLAEGVPETKSPDLHLRARQLATDRSRRALATALTGAVDAAARPRGLWPSRAPLARAAVLEAAGPLVSLARDLRTVDEPRVRGLALASYLVTDAGSPIYNRRSPVTVRELATRARNALAPTYELL
jgi:hypothetical protein